MAWLLGKSLFCLMTRTTTMETLKMEVILEWQINHRQHALLLLLWLILTCFFFVLRASFFRSVINVSTNFNLYNQHDKCLNMKKDMPTLSENLGLSPVHIWIVCPLFIFLCYFSLSVYMYRCWFFCRFLTWNCKFVFN